MKLERRLEKENEVSLKQVRRRIVVNRFCAFRDQSVIITMLIIKNFCRGLISGNEKRSTKFVLLLLVISKACDKNLLYRVFY